MNRRYVHKILAVSLAIVFTATNVAYPLPQDANVVEGEATITVDGNTMNIAASDNTIIDFSSFDIGVNESVIVTLPSIDSDILSRVLGADATTIAGSLSCNGIFILVNTNGIYIADTASIQAAGLVLSTLDINNTDFLDSNYLFKKLSEEQLNMLLLNQGNIQINNGGFAAFIAGAIENQGTIIAPMGTISLASGEAVTLDISGNELISIAIDKEIASTVYDSQGNSILDAISNTGTIEANGGCVILDSESLTGIFTRAINLEGYITANSFEDKDGLIRLSASGSIDSSNATLSAEGGEIDIRLGGDWFGSGIFNGCDPSIEFIDSMQESHIYGDNTFYDFTCTAPSKILYFEEDMIQTILGTWRLEGADGGRVIKLLSAIDGEQWLVDPQGDRDIEFVWVEDSYNISPDEMIIQRSTNRGGCTGWDPDVIWDDGDPGDSNWSSGLNWDNDVGPGIGDNAIFTAVGVGSNTDSFVDPVFSTDSGNAVVGGIRIESGYTGTITLQRSLWIDPENGGAGVFLQDSAGSRFICGDNSFSMSYSTPGSATFSVLAGTFSAPTPGGGRKLYIWDDLTIGASGTFIHNGGIVHFAGHEDMTVTISESGTATFYDLEIEALALPGSPPTPYTERIRFKSDFTVAHNLTVSHTGDIEDTLDIEGVGTNTITVNGDLLLNSANGPVRFGSSTPSKNFAVTLQGNLSHTDSDIIVLANINSGGPGDPPPGNDTPPEDEIPEPPILPEPPLPEPDPEPPIIPEDPEDIINLGGDDTGGDTGDNTPSDTGDDAADQIFDETDVDGDSDFDFSSSYEEGGKRYKKKYKKGKYRTIIIVFEGLVVEAPYDKNGPDFNKGILLKPGEEKSRMIEI